MRKPRKPPEPTSPLIAKGRKQSHVLTEGQKHAIIAACANGAHKGRLAQEFGIRPETISRLLREVKAVQSPSNPLSPDWKESLKPFAQTAVKDAICCKDDPYKRGAAGFRFLEGIGELKIAGSEVNVAILNATPADWRERYITAEPVTPSGSDSGSLHNIPSTTFTDPPTTSSSTPEDQE